jgi:hypothetical protein
MNTVTFLNGKINVASGNLVSELERVPDNDVAAARYNGAMDGIESLLLALVCAGVIGESEDPRVNEAIQSALDGCENNLV